MQTDIECRMKSLFFFLTCKDEIVRFVIFVGLGNAYIGFLFSSFRFWYVSPIFESAFTTFTPSELVPDNRLLGGIWRGSYDAGDGW